MPVRVHLNDGRTFTIDEPLDNVEEAFRTAKENNVVMRIRNGEGKIHSVNPDQVSFIEDIGATDALGRQERAAAQS